MSSEKFSYRVSHATCFHISTPSPSSGIWLITGPKIAGTVWGPGEALAFRQSDKDLKAKFDQGIQAALAAGTVKRLSLKWLKVDATP